LSVQPTDIPVPRPIGYESKVGVLEEKSPSDHVHTVKLEEWRTVPDSEFLNGWSNPTGVPTQFRYLREPSGFVHIEGKLDAGTVAPGTDIYTMPLGYRPDADLRFPVVTDTGLGVITIIIHASGLIELGPSSAVANLYFNIIYEANRETYDAFIN